MLIFVSILVIAIALSLDSFTVSLAAGTCFNKNKHSRSFLRFAFILAIIQGIFTLLGWFMGYELEQFIGSFDHWVAFALLCAIGIKMFYDGLKHKSKRKPIRVNSIAVNIGLGIATSVDALIVGLSLSLLDYNIYISALIISVVTFIFSISALKLGDLLKRKIKFPVEIAGGLMLIIIGISVLFEHLK